MDIEEARSIAHAWVSEEGTALPGFSGAWLAGSTNDLPEGTELDPTSDLDVMVVLDAEEVPAKAGKFRYRGVLLEVSYVEIHDLLDAQVVLGHYHLARSIATARILADPAGHLHRLKETVARHFSDRPWIEARTRQAAETVLARLDSIRPGQPFAEQVMSWLFAVGGLPHIVLVAGLRNPTVRKRYVALRELVEETDIGYREYNAMLDLLDPARMPVERIRHHLETLAEVFDETSGVVRSPVFFASDLSPVARPLAIDGSRELIDAGLHREAIFWIVATFCRCQIVWHADAPPYTAHRWDDAFRALMTDLGIASGEDVIRRGEDVRSMVPEVCDIADRLVHHQ